MSTYNLSNMEIDAVGEILNISLGASATAVSTMLDTRVDITTPVVKVKQKDEFEFASIEPAVGVEIGYVEGLDGSNIMLLKRIDVKVIVELLMGMEIPDDQFELDEMNISAICEVMNQMMGASATALSELLSRRVDISTPVSFEVSSPEQFKEKYFADNDEMVVIRFNLMIADKMESEFLNLMPISLAKELVSGFFPEGAPDAVKEEPQPAPQPAAASSESSGGVLSQEEIEQMLSGGASGISSMPQSEPAPAPAASDSGGGMMSQEAIEQMLNGMSDGGQQAAPQPTTTQEPAPQAAAAQAAPQPAAPQQSAAQAASQPGVMQPQAPVYVQPQMDPTVMNNMMQMMDMMRQSLESQQQQLQELRMASGPRKIKVQPQHQPNLSTQDMQDSGTEDNLEMMMDVPMEISVEIGRTRKMVKDILELNKGSLVVLDKLAGEQVDLFVNGQCIAKGDVVVVDDNFGIRITEIL